MAKIIKAVRQHSCLTEIKNDPAIQDHVPVLWYGSIVECSCGKLYVLTSDQREGDYWKLAPNQQQGHLTQPTHPGNDGH
jgi:hypothetical protein